MSGVRKWRAFSANESFLCLLWIVSGTMLLVLAGAVLVSCDNDNSSRLSVICRALFAGYAGVGCMAYATSLVFCHYSPHYRHD